MNFRTFLTRLAEADARFVVVGGVAASLDGRTFHVAALDDLIDMKRRAGRPQDMLDIEVLEELRSRGV